MSFTATLTNVQGTTFEDAYFEVASATLNENSIQNVFRQNTGNATYGELVYENTENKHLNYQMYYWVSEQHKIDGHMPYRLANAQGVGFSVSNLGSEYDGLSAEEAAEYHCQNVILAE